MDEPLSLANSKADPSTSQANTDPALATNLSFSQALTMQEPQEDVRFPLVISLFFDFFLLVLNDSLFVTILRCA